MIIIPTILEKELDLVFFQIQKLSSRFDVFQIDIADGQFVPNRTITIEEITRSIQNGRFPIDNKHRFDFHLMVNDIGQNLKELKKLSELIKINNVLIHYPHFATDYEPFNEFFIGLVLNPGDSVFELKQRSDINSIPIIQIMTVVPGFQGSPFISEMLNKIDQLKQANYRNKIYLDGGINDQTLSLISSRKNLPDVLCLGSFLTKITATDNVKNRLQKLSLLLK
jgi:D-allulose-6-phosphate 3-epimerase